MHERVFNTEDGDDICLAAILPTQHITTKSCKIPICMSCELAKIQAKTPKVKLSKAIDGKQGILSQDRYETGDMVSSDQFNVHTASRKLTGFGCESN